MNKNIIEAYALLQAGKGGAEQLLEKYFIEELGLAPDFFENKYSEITEKIRCNSDIEFREIIYLKYLKLLSAETLD